MRLVALEKARLTLPEVAKLAQEGLVILTRKGKPMAAVKDLSGFDWEAISLASNPQFMALIEESRKGFRENGGIGLAELRRELDLKDNPPRRKPTRKTRKPPLT